MEGVEDIEEKNMFLILPDGEEIEVPYEGLEIGREDFGDHLPDDRLRYISRRNNLDDPEKNQFEIIEEDGDYFIIDDNSTNGTYLDGENIRGEGRFKLEDGDTIKPANEIKIDVVFR